MQHTATPYNTPQRPTAYRANRAASCLHPATRCNTLHHMATTCGASPLRLQKRLRRRSTLATHCNTLKHTTNPCNTLQQTATTSGAAPWSTRRQWRRRRTLATHSNTFKHAAKPCNTLQHTATHCHHLRCGTIQRTETAEAAQHHGDMHAEGAVVHVRLVDDDVFERTQQCCHVCMLRQHKQISKERYPICQKGCKFRNISKETYQYFKNMTKEAQQLA